MNKLIKLGSIGCLTAVLLVSCGMAKTGTQSASVEGDNLTWAFTQADQHPEQQLIQVIEGSKKTLDMAIYSLTYPGIVQALQEAARRGVAVRVLTDRIQAQGKTQREALKLLGSAGIPMKKNTHSGLMHLKMTIADGQIATTGSFNYSKAASTTNDEMLLIIRDEKVAASFAAEFNRAWNDTKGYETLQATIAEPSSPGETGLTDKEEGTDDVAAPTASPPIAACKNPTIKGNINSRGDKIYHIPGSSNYDRTDPEAMFCTEKDAVAEGFRKSSK